MTSKLRPPSVLRARCGILLTHRLKEIPSLHSSTTSLTCKQVNRAEAPLQFTQEYGEKAV